jgi:hypothetical protein
MCAPAKDDGGGVCREDPQPPPPQTRSAARSSRSTVGDLAGVPLLMNSPCSHCEQISRRCARRGAAVHPAATSTCHAPSASLVPLMRPDLMARNTVDLLMPHASAPARFPAALGR